MKKIIVSIVLFSSLFSQAWYSEIGDMLKRIYDTNNDGIVDRALSVVNGGSNILYATNSGWCLIASNSSNAILFGEQSPQYYTNLLNMIGYITTNQITNLDQFISIFITAATNALILGDTGALLTNGTRAMAAPLPLGGNAITNVPLILPAIDGTSALTIGSIAGDKGSMQLGGGNVDIEGYGTISIGTNGSGDRIFGSTLNGASSFLYGENITIDPASLLTISAGTDPMLINGGVNFASGILSNIQLVPTLSNCAASKYYVDLATNGIGGSAADNLVYTLQGNLVAGSNQVLVHIPYNLTFGTNMGIAVFDAPTFADINIDVHLTNLSILTSSNITITNGGKLGFQTLTATQANAFDELSIHIVQVGLTNSGGNLTISIPVTRR